MQEMRLAFGDMPTRTRRIVWGAIRWIAEYPVSEYQAEIENTRSALEGHTTESAFDPAKSAALIAADESCRNQIETAIGRLWRAP